MAEAKRAQKRTSKKRSTEKAAPVTPRDARDGGVIVINEKLMAPGLATADGPAGLEKHVIDYVDDLDGRRVLSDALLEQGDPRGEYIRLALQLDKLRPWDDGFDTLSLAVGTLAARHGFAWSARARAAGDLNTNEPRWGGTRLGFRRGAVEVLHGQLGDVVDQLEASRDAAPISELSARVDSHAEVERLAASPALARVRRLRLQFEHDAQVGDASALTALLSSRHLVRLDRLELLLAPAIAELAGVMARTPALAALRELSLGSSTRSAGIGPKGLSALIASPVFEGLQHLSLAGQELGAGAKQIAGVSGLESLEITDGGAMALLAAVDDSALTGLRHLALCGNTLQGKALAGLSAPALAELRSLRLNQVGLDAKRILPVLEALNLPELRILDLSSSSLREGGARALAASSAFANVIDLNLGGAALGDKGAAALAQAEGFSSLARLNVSGNALKGEGVRALAEGPILRTVRHLSLRNNKCQNTGGLALAACPSLPRMKGIELFYNWMGVKALRAILAVMEDAEELYLDENNYTVEPVRALAKSTCITKLRTLSTREADARWLKAFAESPAAQNLEQLQLSSSDIDDAAGEALAKLESLGRVSLSFTGLTTNARRALRDKLGPFLTFWPPNHANAG